MNIPIHCLGPQLSDLNPTGNLWDFKNEVVAHKPKNIGEQDTVAHQERA